MISQQNTIETSRVQEKKRVAQELHDGVLGRMFCKNEFDSLNKIQDDRLSAKGIATYLN
jgi:signal transduction histidine kinase